MIERTYVAQAAEDVTPGVLSLANAAMRGRAPDGGRFTWAELWAEMDGARLPNGRVLILGEPDSPAFAVIKEHVERLRRAR